jgi:hypothetical protein
MSRVSRLYLLLGGLVLAGYSYTAWAGLEFANPQRARVPALLAAGSMGSPGSGRTSSYGGSWSGGGGGITGGK